VQGWIFGPKRDKVPGGWRGKKHTEELNDLYSSLIVPGAINTRRMRWAEHVARMGRGSYMVLVGKPVGKEQLGRTRRRWEDNIKMGHNQIGLD
jgi:hypothetical protein